jgi:hypothetical protein
MFFAWSNSSPRNVHLIFRPGKAIAMAEIPFASGDVTPQPVLPARRAA